MRNWLGRFMAGRYGPDQLNIALIIAGVVCGVIADITHFMPLTLIVGWYGMNFRYMPELESPFGYPVVIVVSITIAVACLLFFKRKKWL